MFGKVHHPIGHGQIVHVEQRAILFERRTIFAMGVNHDDMAVRGDIAHLMHDESGAGGFAGTR